MNKPQPLERKIKRNSFDSFSFLELEDVKSAVEFHRNNTQKLMRLLKHNKITIDEFAKRYYRNVNNDFSDVMKK